MPRNRTQLGLKMSAKPKWNPVRDLDPETADAALPLPTTTQGQRTEQMYQLADIFASIFEALPEEYEHAIASTPEAA